MATKVYDSPTMNLFALLADENVTKETQPKKNPKVVAAPGPELTPKERAEAKAVQDAQRKAQREAEKAKKEAEEARKKALELVDTTGFGQQRHQRIKVQRIQERKAPEPSKNDETQKGEGKGKGWKGKDWSEGGSKGEGKGKGEGKPKGDRTDKSKDWNEGGSKGEGKGKGEGKPKGDWNKNKDSSGNKAEGSENKGTDTTKASTFKDKPFKGEGKNNYKGEGKSNFKGEGKGYKAGPGGSRQYDKHSQGVTSRNAPPKKQGHGKDNWDDPVPAGLNAAPVSDALASEALAAPVGGEDGWGDTPTTNTLAVPTDDPGWGDNTVTPLESTNATTTQSGAPDKPKDKDEEDDKKTFQQYLAEQEEKRKALAELAGFSTPQPRELTDEERKALTKFTLVENTKLGPVKKTEPKPPKTPAAAPVVVVVPSTRKGEKPLDESLVQFRVAGARSGRGRGARFEDFSPAGRGQRKTRPQKIHSGRKEFPDLGPK